MTKIDSKFDRIIDDMGELKLRVSALERKLAELHCDAARLSTKSDKIDDCIEQLTGLIDRHRSAQK